MSCGTGAQRDSETVESDPSADLLTGVAALVHSVDRSPCDIGGLPVDQSLRRWSQDHRRLARVRWPERLPSFVGRNLIWWKRMRAVMTLATPAVTLAPTEH